MIYKTKMGNIADKFTPDFSNVLDPMAVGSPANKIATDAVRSQIPGRGYSKNWIVGGIISSVIFLIIIGFSAYYFLFKKKSNEPAASCERLECAFEGQMCLKGSPGASDGDYKCQNRKWEKVT